VYAELAKENKQNIFNKQISAIFCGNQEKIAHAATTGLLLFKEKNNILNFLK
jgi:hypothetical protein